MMNNNVSQKIMVASIGCRTNQQEMGALSSSLAHRGYQLVNDAVDADIIIVNTCSVTTATEIKTTKYIKALSRKAPKARIVVTGCLAQQSPEELDKINGVTWVVGNAYKDRIETIIDNKDGGVFQSSLTSENTASLTTPKKLIPPNHPSVQRTRFSIKIQEGCDYRCSYCIVPLLRGPSRSALCTDITETCSRAIAVGYKEIILTGTHIGQFFDKKGNRLLDIVNKIANIDGDFRVRLSSLDPRDCSEDLLFAIGTNSKICDHVHVSLQSCSKHVLLSMNRPADITQSVIERLVQFRKSFPHAACGADIIVGFPGESDSFFNETCNHIDRIGLTYAHIFRFSSRPETPAAIMGNQVEEAVKTKRSTQLRKIVAVHRNKFLHQLQHTTQRIIVESSNPVRGITSNFVHVEIPDCVLEPNTWLDVSLTGKTCNRYCSAQPVISKVA